jgi:hypothetical protein
VWALGRSFRLLFADFQGRRDCPTYLSKAKQEGAATNGTVVSSLLVRSQYGEGATHHRTFLKRNRKERRARPPGRSFLSYHGELRGRSDHTRAFLNQDRKARPWVVVSLCAPRDWQGRRDQLSCLPITEQEGTVRGVYGPFLPTVALAVREGAAKTHPP